MNCKVANYKRCVPYYIYHKFLFEDKSDFCAHNTFFLFLTRGAEAPMFIFLLPTLLVQPVAANTQCRMAQYMST